MNEHPLESFVFYRSFRDAISEMTDENKLATLLAICDYALYGVEPELEDAMSRAVFTVARPSIDANKCRRTNGKKGGRPPKKPMVSDSENLWFSKSESTETETETEAVSESVSGASPHTPKKGERERFIPPTLKEVQDYCMERENGIDPEEFIAFYESKGWKVGRASMKSWKAAVVTWEKKRATTGAGKGADQYADVV